MADMPPTLVFIHGSGDSAQVWEPLIAALPDEYTYLALDLPGHGALLDQPPADASVAGYASFVSQELQRRGIVAPTILGHSLGGAVALRLALDAPQQVARLVLIGTGARLRVSPVGLERARKAGPTGDAELTRLSFSDAHAADALAYQQARRPTTPGMLYRDLIACDAFDIMAEVGSISAPSLVVVGAEDRMTPEKYSRFLADKLPHAKLVVVPEAGHYVQIEQPDQVASALRAWLS